MKKYVMIYLKILGVALTSFGPPLYQAYAAENDGQAPTWNRTDVNCGAPTGGTFTDGHGNTICPDCFDRNFGINNRVWDNDRGYYVPPNVNGSGSAASSCKSGCHR